MKSLAYASLATILLLSPLAADAKVLRVPGHYDANNVWVPGYTKIVKEKLSIKERKALLAEKRAAKRAKAKAVETNLEQQIAELRAEQEKLRVAQEQLKLQQEALTPVVPEPEPTPAPAPQPPRTDITIGTDVNYFVINDDTPGMDCTNTDTYKTPYGTYNGRCHFYGNILAWRGQEEMTNGGVSFETSKPLVVHGDVIIYGMHGFKNPIWLTVDGTYRCGVAEYYYLKRCGTR